MSNLETILQVNDKCTRCGLCAEDCPSRIIAVKEDGPTLLHNTCIRCGHCEAICPTDAIHNTLLSHEDTPSLKGHPPLSAEEAEFFLRRRRSIRCYQDKPVPRDVLEKLIRMGRFAETGSNRQGISYLVVTDEAILNQLRKNVLELYRANPQFIASGNTERFFASDHDRVLRGAPVLLIALADESIRQFAFSNAQFSLTYIELYATSLGLGTCWAGYVERYIKSEEAQLNELLRIPKGKCACGAIMVGYPKYSYGHLPDRNPAVIDWR